MMYKNLESYFQRLKSSGLKAAPNKINFSEESSIPWIHCFRQRNPTSCQKSQDLKKLKSPENKKM